MLSSNHRNKQTELRKTKMIDHTNTAENIQACKAAATANRSADMFTAFTLVVMVAFTVASVAFFTGAFELAAMAAH